MFSYIKKAALSLLILLSLATLLAFFRGAYQTDEAWLNWLDNVFLVSLIAFIVSSLALLYERRIFNVFQYSWKVTGQSFFRAMREKDMLAYGAQDQTELREKMKDEFLYKEHHSTWTRYLFPVSALTILLSSVFASMK